MSHGDWKDMFKAVQENNIEIVRFHISIGTDINFQHPKFFTTVLIESIRLNNHSITKLLIENGADIELKESYSNKNAIQIAKELNNQVAIQIILFYLNKK